MTDDERQGLDQIAREIATLRAKLGPAATDPPPGARLITVNDLATRIAQLETNLTRTILKTYIALTATFAFFVIVMSWVLTAAITAAK